MVYYSGCYPLKVNNYWKFNNVHLFFIQFSSKNNDETATSMSLFARTENTFDWPEPA